MTPGFIAFLLWVSLSAASIALGGLMGLLIFHIGMITAFLLFLLSLLSKVTT